MRTFLPKSCILQASKVVYNNRIGIERPDYIYAKKKLDGA